MRRRNLDVLPHFPLIRAWPVSSTQDDLFIVGGSPQRIYGKTCGCSAAAVSNPWPLRKLRKINYRHHRGNARLGHGRWLPGLDFDDLDGGSDPPPVTTDRCFHGEQTRSVQGF